MQDIITAIDEFKSKLKSQSEHIGGIFVTLGGHGAHYDYFHTEDSEMHLYCDVIDQFNGRNFGELLRVPKVFLVNICR